MTDEKILLIGVEPPLNVGNSVLEAARHLAGDLAVRGVTASWVPPEMYAASLVTLVPDSEEARLYSIPRIHAVVHDQEELAVQLMPLTVETIDDGTFAVVSRMTAPGEAMTDLTEHLAKEFADTSLTVTIRPVIGIVVAFLGNEAVTAAARALLPEGRDVPIAGWLLGGLHLMTATWRQEDCQFEINRLRHHPFRRLGSRPE